MPGGQWIAATYDQQPGQVDFAELTAANELDIMRVNSDLRAQYGPGLLRLFGSWRRLLTDPAWRAVLTSLRR